MKVGTLDDATRTRHPSTLVTCAADLDDLTDPWLAIEPHLPWPTQSLAWIKSGAQSLGGDGLRVHVVDKPSWAAAPFVWRSEQRMLETLTTTEIYAPSDLAYTSSDALEALLEVVAQSGETVRLPRLLADSPTIAAVRRVLGRRALVVQRRCAACPYIDLEGSAGDADALLHSSMRSHLRRSRRIARAMGGELRVEIFDRRTAPALEPLLRRAVEIEARSWKGEAGTALLYDPPRRQFFQLYAAMAWSQGALRVSFLHLDDVPIAMQISVEHDGRWYALKLGYDAAYRACSPGSLLKYEVIRHAVATGLRSYEFVGAPAPWTLRWTSAHRECVDLRIYPASTRGATTLIADAGTWTRRRLQTRVATGAQTKRRE